MTNMAFSLVVRCGNEEKKDRKNLKKDKRKGREKRKGRQEKIGKHVILVLKSDCSSVEYLI